MHALHILFVIFLGWMVISVLFGLTIALLGRNLRAPAGKPSVAGRGGVPKGAGWVERETWRRDLAAFATREAHHLPVPNPRPYP